MSNDEPKTEQANERIENVLSSAINDRDAYKVERDAAIANLNIANAEIDKLRFLIKQLQRAQFGRSSEKINPDQLKLALEDLEQSAAQAEAEKAAAAAAAAKNKKDKAEAPTRAPRQYNRGSLPSHLPREDVVIEPDEKDCPCCGGALHVIGEDVSEQLDIVPAQFKVKVIHRPRYGCRGCTNGVVQALAPERLVAGCMATVGLVVHVLIGKYLDSLPLYRQCQIYSRSGINLDRSTLAEWVGHACFFLKPLWEELGRNVFASEKLFADDTTAPVLQPGRGRTKTGRIWAYVRDDRPWQGPLPPAVIYIYEPDRTAGRPISHLKNFKGVLQVDAYRGFDILAADRVKHPERGLVTLVHCWAHGRRKFFEIHVADNAPIAAGMLLRIGALYAIEDEIRGRTADERLAVRQARSKPIIDEMKPWLMERLAELPGKGKLAGAIRYLVSRWDSMTRFLDDGRIELDTNIVERAIRPLTIGRKNFLFAGSDGGGKSWAIVSSLIQSAKLNGIEPYAYLKDVLERLVAGHPITRLDELLPWHWKPPVISPAPGNS